MASTAGRAGRPARLALAALLVLCACSDDALSDASSKIRATPDALDFGAVFVGDRMAREVELRSDGRAAAMLSVAFAPDGFLVEPASAVLPAGGTIRVQVIFAPTSTGDTSGEVLLTDGDVEVGIDVSGTAVGRQLEAPAEVDLGAAFVGQRVEGAVRLVNRSALPVSLTPSVSGGDAADFWPASGPLELPAGAFADFRITFAPSFRGPAAALLRLYACDACDPLEVELKGQGLLDRVVADPGSLDFGDVVVGSARELQVSLRNLGDADRTLETYRVVPAAAGFRVDRASLPITIVRDGAGIVTVAFAPETTGFRAATLELLDERGELVVAVPVSGSGVDSTVVATPAVIDFGTQGVNTATSRTLEVTAEGGTVQVTSVAVEGTGTPFVASPTRPVPTSVGAPLVVTVVYRPQSAGVHGAMLVIRTDHPLRPELRIPLAGNALVTGPCRLAVSPELPFGLVRAGSVNRKALTFTDIGLGECRIAGFVFEGPAGPFSLEEVETPWSVMPGLSRDLQVTYAPEAGSLESSSVTVRITSNDPTVSSLRVRLTGTAFAGDLRAIPDPIDFGTISLGRPAIRTVELRNAGELPLTLQALGFASGAPASLVVRSSPSVPFVLPPGAGATVAIAWSPTVPITLATALEAWVDGQSAPKRIEIRGVSVAEPCGAECHTPVAVCSGRVVTEVTKEVVLPGGGLDPDGDAVTCQWSLVSVPTGSRVALAARLPCDTALTPDIVGDYQLQLEVRDPSGLKGTCRTEVRADAYSGLWIETFWDLDADVDLHLLNPAHHAGIDPFDAWSWGGTDGADCFYWSCRRGVATLARPDTPGPLDDPSLDVDSQHLGPENIRVDVPSRDHPYWVGVHWLYNPLGHARVQVTTNVYCAGVLAATEVATLLHREHAVLGAVNVNPDGTCAFTPSGVRLSY